MIPIVGGLLGLIGLIFFISAIPYSYQIEARSNPERFGGRRRGYTNIWAVIVNYRVAKDEETQALRKKVLIRMAIVLVCMAGLAVLSIALGIERTEAAAAWGFVQPLMA